ncbi:hypothetical protein A2U01_0070370, partial [Trifolium medium]|nr:hypothetical protein [Trifolium medium]
AGGTFSRELWGSAGIWMEEECSPKRGIGTGNILDDGA